MTQQEFSDKIYDILKKYNAVDELDNVNKMAEKLINHAVKEAIKKRKSEAKIH